jgi:hypothetical protein
MTTSETTAAPRNTEEQLAQLCYRLARHLLNPDKIRLTTWARIGLEMLAELRDIDPAKYAEMMKPNAPDQARVLPSSEAGCSACRRCGGTLEGGVCSDETCPFSDHLQTCERGWIGHPEHTANEDTPCTCKPNAESEVSE